MDDGTGVTRA
ncbi:hypothetical protein CF336_g8677, partial [Tilletia laevis]